MKNRLFLKFRTFSWEDPWLSAKSLDLQPTNYCKKDPTVGVFLALFLKPEHQFWRTRRLLLMIFFWHNISLKLIGGECKSVTDKIVSSWNETTLLTILSNYKLEDIFQAGELVSSTNAFPIKPFILNGKSAPEGRNAKSNWNGGTKCFRGRYHRCFSGTFLKNPNTNSDEHEEYCF